MTPPPPSDEFDAVVLQHDGRRGAHRAKPHRVSAVLSAGLVAAATMAVAGGAYVLLDAPAARSSTPAAGTSAVAAGAVVDAPATGAAPTSDASPGTGSGPTAGADGAAATSGAAASTPVPAVTPSRSATSPAPTGTATSRATATTRATATARSTRAAAAGRTDATVPLVVLNGTRTKGLASTASTRLHAGGWRVQSTGNDRSGATATTVSYADPALAATATAVAADVGGSAVHDAHATEGVLTVVLGSDYSG